MKKKERISEGGAFRSFEIWTDHYLYNVFPNDGDAFTVLDEERRRFPHATLVEVVNGERTIVSEPLDMSGPEFDYRPADDELYADWQEEDFS